MDIISVNSSQRNEFIDITRKINDLLRNKNINNGICLIFVPHTTAAITINENADPDVISDLKLFFCDLVNENKYNFRHVEGNSDAHIKSSIIGNSLYLIIENGKLQLGTWQGIYFCEFDGPRNRKVYVKFIEG